MDGPELNRTMFYTYISLIFAFMFSLSSESERAYAVDPVATALHMSARRQNMLDWKVTRFLENIAFCLCVCGSDKIKLLMIGSK